MSMIEERGVRFTFNNGNFKSKISETLNGLESLDQKVKGIGKKSADFSKFLSSIQKVSGISGMQKLNNSTKVAADGVELLSKKFSALDIVGYTVINRLTNSVISFGRKLINNVIGPITQGGWRRALNIEQARFQLEGLFGDKTVKVMEDGKKKVVKITEEIEKNAMDAVDSTAYGFDSSVKVASQLAASSVKAGKDMTGVLKAVAGSAAMTNSSFDEMGHIFTTVAGNNKLLTEQVRQFSYRGLNVTAILKDYLNANEKVRKSSIELGLKGGKSKDVKEFADATKLTENNINSLISSSGISFKTFSDAMEQAFGEHAKRANDTFTGSLSNLKAALSRIGADVFLEQLTNLRDIFNSITPVINNVRKALQPSFIKELNKQLKTGTNVITTFFHALEDSSYTGFMKGIPIVATAVGYLKTAFSNIAEAVQRFGNIVSRAFDDVFRGSLTAGDIFSRIAYSFMNFTKTLEFSLTTASNIHDTFEGLFTIFKIFGKIVSGVAKVIFPLAETGGSFVDLFFAITGAIGRFIVKVDAALDKLGLFKGGINALVSVVQGFISVWHSFAKGMTEIVNSFSAGKRVESMAEGLVTSFSGLGALPEFISSVFKRITSGLDNGLKAIASSLSGRDISTAMDLFSSGALIVIAAQVNEFVKQLTTKVSNIGGAVGDVSGALKQLKGVLVAYQQSIKADAIKKIAVSIAMLAGAMLILSSLDSEGIIKGAVAIEILFLELVSAIRSLAEISAGGPKALAQLAIIASTIKSMAEAILILSVAMKILGTMGWDELLAGVVSIKVLLNSLVKAVSELATKEKVFVKGAMTMIGMAIAIDILAAAIKKLGAMDLESLGKGLGAVGAMMLALSLFISKTSFDKGFGLKAAVGMVALGASMMLMANAVSKMSEIDSESLVKGLVAMGAVLTEMSIFIKSIEKSKNVLSSAVLLASLALVLNQMASAFSTFSGMSWEGVGKGLAAVGGSLLIMAAAIRLMGDGRVLSGAVAMVAVAAAVRLLTPALVELGNLNVEQIGLALLAIAGAFTVLGVAAAILTPLIGPILALAGAIALLGIGVAALGAGLIMFTAGAAGFVAALTTVLVGLSSMTGLIMTTIQAFLAEIAKAIPQFVATGAKMIIGFLKGMAKEIGGIVTHAVTLVVKFLKALEDNLPKIVDAAFKFVITFINAFSDAIEENGPELLEALGGLLTKMVGLLLAAIPLLVAGAVKAGKSMIKTLKKYLGDFPEAAKKIVESGARKIGSVAKSFGHAAASLAKSVYQGFKDKVKAFLDYVKGLPGRILKALGNHVGEFRDAGKNMINGVIEGFKGMFDNALQAVASFGSGLVSSFKRSLGIKSPSRKFFECAVYCIKGFTNAIVQKGSKAYNAVHDMGSTMVGTLSNALRKTYELASTDLNLDPTIRPVVDMTNVKAASKTMDDVFASPTYGLTTPSTGIRLAETIAADIQNGGNLNVASQLGKLTKRLDSVTQAMNSRQMNNYFQIDGSSDPEGFADAVAGRLELNARTL